MKQVKIGRYWQAKAGAKQPDNTFTLSEARVKFAELKGQRNGGISPAELVRERKEVIRLDAANKAQEKKLKTYCIEDLCEDYLADCIDGHRTKKAAAEARRALWGDPVAKMGDVSAAEVTPKDIIDMTMAIVERGANVQAGFILRELTAAFDHAIGEELPENMINPCYQARGKLKRKRIKLTNNKGTRVLNDGELAAFLTWLPGSRFTSGQKGVLHFTLMTGCRTGEACAMRWQDVDLENSVWHLKETKTGVPRDVQLSPQAVEFLDQQKLYSDDYVFPNVHGAQIQQKTLTETTWRLRREERMLKIDHWTPHDLRRSVRTGLARIGCPSEVAEAILGHVKGGIEGIYNLHRYERECSNWLQKWCDHLDVLKGADNVVPFGVKHG
jgi:integrase